MKPHDSEPDGQNSSPDPATAPDRASRRAALGQALTVLSGAALTTVLPAETRAELSTQGGRLVLQDRDLGKRLNQLFTEVKSDKTKEKEFVYNPIGVLGMRVAPRAFRGVSQQRVENANRVLYSLLANDQFLGWLRRYQKQLDGARLDKGKVLKDFAAAMARYADPEFFQGLMEEEAATFANPGATQSEGLIVLYEDVIASHNYTVIVWRGEELMYPAEMRSLTELLAEKAVATAKDMKTSGALQKEIIGQ